MTRVLAHVSDPHFGRVDPAVVEGLAADLSALAPDLVVVSGDLVQTALTRNFIAARAFLDRLPFPKLVVPGNHDIPRYDLFNRFLGDPFARYRRHICDDLNPVVMDDEIAMVGLNTARSLVLDFSQGRVNRAQLAHLRAVFAAAPKGATRIVVTHHPFLPPPDRPHTRLVGRHQMALPVLAEAGVDVLLSGHLHRGFTGDLGEFHTTLGRSMLVIQAATSTSTRLRGDANAYNHIVIERGVVSCEARVWNGRAFQPSPLTRLKRVD